MKPTLKKKRWPQRRTRQTVPRPSLRFSPYAWAKLVYLRDRGETEIGGFGLSAEDDPLFVVDLLVPKQRTTVTTVKFDDASVADLLEDCVDRGIPPARVGRIWIHTHPGRCALPSFVDEATFRRVFGRTEWSVMAIVARGGARYARLAFHVGPGGSLELPVRVDYRRPFAGADVAAWEREYATTIIAEVPTLIGDDVGMGLLAEERLFGRWDADDLFELGGEPSTF